MTDTIPPALTSEQWNAGEVTRGEECESGSFNAYIDGNGRCLNVGNNCIESESWHDNGRNIATIIALANHALPDDDPRKITHALVATLRQYSGDLSRMELPAHYADATRRIWEIAEVLDSLLPPRET